MGDYLKTLNIPKRDRLSWDDIKLILELQTYLGLKPGIHSKEGFKRLSPQERSHLFAQNGVSIAAKLQRLQSPKISMQLTLER